MLTKLRTLPIEIDADEIAKGLLEMFDDNECVALRFGLLPFVKMEALRKEFERRFLEMGVRNLVADDQFVAVMSENSGYPRHIEFSMKELVAEAVHKVSLALYKIGDLVV